MNKVVLGFSGGLDTSFCVVWLRDHGFEPVCVTLDIGQGKDTEEVRTRCQRLKVETRFVDGLDTFSEMFVLPALQFNALYEGVYPLATALSRPYIGKVMADLAQEVGTTKLAHGSTGKGNDQVRIEMAIRALLPGAEIIDPIRDNNLDREYEIEFLKERGYDLGFSVEKPYSVDQNIWGRSICAGVLEDAAVAPPEEIFEWTLSPERSSGSALDLTIRFEQGVPVALDGTGMKFREIVDRLNRVGGGHGIGRIDHIENRLVGIKSREIYEAPAAVILIKAHQTLEGITLTKGSLDFKRTVEAEYARIIYLGDWFSAHHFDLLSYLKHNQRVVSGEIKMRCYKGNLTVLSRSSDNSLYQKALATYGKGSLFEQRDGAAFSAMLSNSSTIAARKQLGLNEPEFRNLLK